MGDTLRSIAEKWCMIARKIDDGTHTSECGKRACDFRSRAAELATLLAEYEKVDLVKRWRDKADDIGRVAGISADAGKLRTCAAELETWLAVNLERIKAEGRDAILGVLIEKGYLKGKEIIVPKPIKTSHGSCCVCPDCHQHHDDCVCEHNELLAAIRAALSWKETEHD